MNVEEYLARASEQDRKAEESEPGFLRTVADAVSTNIVGGNTFVRMVERKRVMVRNDEDETRPNFSNSQEFLDIVKAKRPNISAAEMEELRGANNPRYLNDLLDNQNRYYKSIERLENMGLSSLPYEIVAGTVDPVSWLAGGAIFKGVGAGLKSFEALQTGAGKFIADSAQGAITGVTTIGISEAAIQAEVGVVDQDRLNNSMLFAGALGAGLPLIANVLTHRTAGAARQQTADSIQQGIAQATTGKSLRSIVSLSAADQAINDSFSPTLKQEGVKFVTPVNAPRDANGNIIVAEQTSMNYVESFIGKQLSSIGGNLEKNSKTFGNKREKQGFEDGSNYDLVQNSLEQESRRLVANADDMDLINEYKAATGIEEMPFDIAKREAIENYNLKIQEIETKFNNEIARLQAELPDTDLTKPISRLKASKTKALNKVQKELDDFNPPPLKDVPDDFFDVLVENRKQKLLEDGTIVIPQHLKYIQDFYVNYADEANVVGLKGMEGKKGNTYNHIEYNFEYMLRNPEVAKQQLRESLLGDSLTQSLIRRGFVKEEDIAEEAERLFKIATKRELVNQFFDDKLGGLSTSPLGRRRLHMDRSLHPELFVKDIEVKAAKYADRMTGRMALKKIHGMDRDAQDGLLSTTIKKKITQIGEEAQANGATLRQAEKDMANAEALYHTILGTRKYQENADSFTNTAVRMSKKAANALFGAGFVKWAIIEPTVAVMRYGLKNVLSNYVPAYKVLMEHIRNVDSTDPMVRMLRNAGLAVNTIRAQRFDRLDNFEVTPTVSKFEHWLDLASHWGRKYSGFNWINDFNDTLAMMSTITDLEQAVIKGTLTKADEAMYARYGLSIDDVRDINNQPLIRTVSNNKTFIDSWNVENWTDKELAEKFQEFLGRSVRDTVVRADGTRVHRVQSDLNNPIAQLALQFTSMPVALTERTLYNLTDEVSMKTAVGIVSAISFTYVMLSLEDAALVATGAREEPMEQDKLLALAVARTPMAGIVPNIVDTGLALFKQPAIGSAYMPKQDLGAMLGGAGLSVANSSYRTLTGIFDGFNETDASNLLKLTPIINSIPLVSYYMKGLESQLAKEGKDADTPNTYQYINPLQRQ